MSFKCLTGCASGYLSTQFIRRCDVTNRRTRSSQMLNIPRFRTACGQSLFTIEQLLYGIPYLMILNFANRLTCLNAALGLLQTPLHSCAEPNSFKFDYGATLEGRLIQTAYSLPQQIRQTLQKRSKQFSLRQKVRNSVQTCG